MQMHKEVKQILEAKADLFIEMIFQANGNGKLIWENLNKQFEENKKC